MAGPQSKPNSKTNAKSGANPGTKKKGKSEASLQPQMKLVGVDTCIKCPTQCQRGLQYIEKMSTPGSIGTGVPCILTLK